MDYEFAVKLEIHFGQTYPPSKLPENARKLRGFNWRENEEPRSKEDIFIKDD